MRRPLAGPPVRPRGPLSYVIRPGDTLPAIARRFGVAGGWHELYLSNRRVLGTNPSLARPGTRLTVRSATRG